MISFNDYESELNIESGLCGVSARELIDVCKEAVKTLLEIHITSGDVCADFEVCKHESCNASAHAYLRASEFLRTYIIPEECTIGLHRHEVKSDKNRVDVSMTCCVHERCKLHKCTEETCHCTLGFM